MRFSTIVALAASLAATVAQPVLDKRAINDTALEEEISTTSNENIQTAYGKPFAVYQPKAFIISMFAFEEAPWYDALDLTHNITIPGLSPQYPTIHCTTNYTICQLTTGEGEINAASTITALSLNPLFDLTKTYFLIAGIGGGEPKYTTIGSVTFAKYAVQAALEYEIDYREYINTNPNWTTGYFPFGTNSPLQYPGNVYGTEVFELNENLRNRAFDLASKATLDNGTAGNAKFRALYNETAARAEPAVVKCDVLTSDVYFTGNVLGDYFSEFTSMITNGSATYCSTAQEDNASLEAFVRADRYGFVDYERIIVMRTISDFSRPPPSLANNTVKFFTDTDFGGSSASFANLVNAGFPILHDILEKWDEVYEKGEKYAPTNYVGDIFATLGGTPDFGKDDFDIA